MERPGPRWEAPVNEEQRARALAEDWQQSHPKLAGLDAHLVEFDGYWWASFRPPGAERPNLGGVVLLIDLDRKVVSAASGSRSPEQRIADHEASTGGRAG